MSTKAWAPDAGTHRFREDPKTPEDGGEILGRRGKKKQFWLSEQQAEDLAEKAKRACMTETDLVRLLLRGYVPPERPGPEFFEDMNRISEFAERLQTLSTVTSGEEAQELLESEAKAWRTFRLEMERKYLMPERRKTEWQ